MFRITRDPIVAPAAEEPRAGACVTFEGKVRNHNEGQGVEALEYEAYEELAVSEGSKILQEALERFDILDVRCEHRIGTLAIGDVAVRVDAWSAHRKDAFLACEYVIDEVKARVPIWKKEHYTTGVTEWIAAHCAATEAEYYARQMRVPGFGEEGQRRLRESTVLVVGAGGLGCAVLPYLAAAGVGTIVIADSDVVDISNLHRQVLFATQDVGRSKASVAARRLSALNPFVKVEPRGERITVQTIDRTLDGVDLVVDCTDNFATKFLLNDACVASGIPLVQASLYQFEGQLHVFDPKDPVSGCLRCLWPETPPEGCVGACADAGVLGVIAGVFGVLQAMEAVKVLAAIGEPLTRDILLLDLLTATSTRIRRTKNPACPVCSPEAKPNMSPFASYEVDPSSDLSEYVMVDIREEEELFADPFPEAIWMPMSRFTHDDPRLRHDERYLLVCAHGVRSAYLAHRLHSAGMTNFSSLPGGRESVLARRP